MKVVGVVRAFSSMRFKGLPIDFLGELQGKTVLEHSINRMKRAQGLDEIVLVTSNKDEDQIFIEIAKKCKIKYFVGKGEDYLIWMGQLTDELKADWIVENIWTSPLFDFSMVEPLIQVGVASGADYIVNVGTISRVLEVFPLMYNPEKLKEFYKDNILLSETKELMEGISADLRLGGSLQYEDVKENRGYLLYWLLAKRGRVEYAKIDSPWQKYLIENKHIKDIILKTRLAPSKGIGFEIVKRIYENFYNPSEDLVDLDQVFQSLIENPEPIPRILSYLIIELTNQCELDCIMCPRQKMSREIGYMEMSLFGKIVDECEGLGVQQIDFSLMGEPLLHPEFIQILKTAKDKMVDIGIYANGVNLTEEIARAILDYEVKDIIINLPAATPETYKKITGKDDFQKVIANITDFLKLKKEKVAGVEKDTPGWWSKVKPTIGIQILKMKETDAEIEQFMDKWDFQDKVRKMLSWKQKMEEVSKELKPLEEELDKIKDRLNWKEPAKGEISDVKKPQEVIEVEAKLAVKSQELMKPLNELYWKTFYEKFLPVEHAVIGHFNNFCGQIEDRSAIDVTPLKRFSCRQLQSGASILWNGDVVMCQQDFDGKYVLANIKNSSLIDIWERQKLKELRVAHFNGEYDRHPLCAKCKEWYYGF